MKTPKDELRRAKTADDIKQVVQGMGWTIEHGKRHDQAAAPSGAKVAIPRHKGDLPKGTLFSIIKRILIIAGSLLSVLYVLIESGILR